ncbi:MAG TPA: glycine oxidase ThiO [Terriglobales bacterium]|nr:glycine oxidase ThiO [Terriglobales bacterium]
MTEMKSWDAIILGGGIIGLSLARELRRHGASVLIIERSEPGREASYAAAGMLAPWGGDLPPSLQSLAEISARMYPEFVAEVEDESGHKVDLRDQGAIVFFSDHEHSQLPEGAMPLAAEELGKLEPHISASDRAFRLEERSVDPRALAAASFQAARHHNVDVVSGSPVTQITRESSGLSVHTTHSHYPAAWVVNCCGAWAGEIKVQGTDSCNVPVHPVKGQMLSVVAPQATLQRVVRTPEVYLVPRSDGRILIGATVEEAGFDKRVDPADIRLLRQEATKFVPQLGEARMLEAWAGLRPSTPDDLPILSATETPGYFVATGHFRNGILLAPITAQLMGELVRGSQPELDISSFALARFQK